MSWFRKLMPPKIKHEGTREKKAVPAGSNSRTAKSRRVADQSCRTPSSTKRTSASEATATASSTRLRASG